MDNKKIKFFIKKSPSCFKTNIYILKQVRGGFQHVGIGILGQSIYATLSIEHFKKMKKTETISRLTPSNIRVIKFLLFMSTLHACI
ncbi:hypothetical protein BBP22_15335 [Bacillus paralicheniformis]|nr:hypothetical protein BBP22_15335 [Bacillus paralicheniformis]